jgi:N-acetylglutamate synthase-like GNAT family acetyltransferase
MNLPHQYRNATMDDLPELRRLMNASIRKYIGAILDSSQVEASFEIMGVDTSLIEDMTYFVIERSHVIVGCGGWSRRATLYGGDHTRGRDARLLDPLTEPARVRAMYIHPEFGRQGIGSFLLTLCEAAARKEGFSNLELMSTVSGEALYLNRGYRIVERVQVSTSKGIEIPLIRMAKQIG